MDEQVLEMMRDRFDAIDDTLKALNTNLREHTEKDDRYWLKIDQQAAQIGLIKWIFGGGAFAAVVVWYMDKKFGGH